MNKNIIKISTLLATSLWASQLLAGTVTIPNTFVSGTAASASEVNANFDTLKTEVDDNDNRIVSNTANITANTNDISANEASITANTNSISAVMSQVQLKDANGGSVGRVIGMAGIASPYILTNQGYRSVLAIGQGAVGEQALVSYESTDCTGSAYVTTKRHIGAVFLPFNADTVSAHAAGELLYVPLDASGVMINIKSTLNADLINCDPVTPTGTGEGYEVYPNEQNITGIENTVYATRMLIE